MPDILQQQKPLISTTTDMPIPETETDMTDQYNTALTPDEEKAFRKWMKANGKTDNEMFNYDLRGFWKSGGQFSENGHASDQFKKPNHPTFSDQSVYHGKDGYAGGQWTQFGGKWIFQPSDTNLKMLEPGQLRQYWKAIEEPHGNMLALPLAIPPINQTGR